MENGKPVPPPVPPKITPELVMPDVPEATLFCHRFFVQMAFPVPDQLRPGQAKITPQVANIACAKEKCMLWNSDAAECWEKTAFKGQARAGELAYAKLNDVSIEGGGQ